MAYNPYKYGHFYRPDDRDLRVDAADAVYLGVDGRVHGVGAR